MEVQDHSHRTSTKIDEIFAAYGLDDEENSKVNALFVDSLGLPGYPKNSSSPSK